MTEDSESDSIPMVRRKILMLSDEEDWSTDMLMIAMAGLLTEMLEQGHTPRGWAQLKERWEGDNRAEDILDRHERQKDESE